MITAKTLFINLLLITLLLPGAVCADQAKARQFLDRAQSYLSSGNVRAAVIELKNAVREAPDDQSIRLDLGRLYLKTGDYQTAAKELTKALASGAPRSSTLLPLAQALAGAGQPQAVSELLAKESNLSPKLLSLRASAALESGDLKLARSDFEAAIAIDPQRESALLGLARVEILGGADAEAKRRIRQAISAAPESPEPWRLLGDLQLKQKQMKKALASYQTALKLAPQSTDIGLRVGALLFDNGDFDAAKSRIEPLLAAAPNNPSLQLLTAAINLKQHHLAEAVAILDPLVAHYPNNATALLYLGQTLLEQKKYEQTIDVAQRYQALRPQLPDGTLLLGLANARGGSAKRGAELLQPLLDQAPNNSQLLSALRIAATRQGDYEQAAAYESRIADLSQASAQLGEALEHIRQGERDTALDLLGKTTALYPDLYQAKLLQYRELIVAGKFQDAASTARDLTRMLPDNARMHLLYGIALAGQKNYSGAEKAINKAWRLDPGSPEIGHRLALLYQFQKHPAQANTVYQEILAKHPDDANTLIRLAQLNFRSGEQAAGLDALRRAVDAAPGELRPRATLSKALARSGELQQGLDVMEEVYGRYASNAGFVRWILQLQIGLQDWPAALETSKQLLQLEPQSALAYLHLAEVHGRSGNIAAMAKAITKALAAEGASGINTSQLLRLATLAGDAPKPRRLLEEIQKKQPADTELAAALFVLSVRQQRYEDALAISTRMQQHYPDQPRWAVYEIQALHRAGRNDAAAARMQQALQQFPHAPGLEMLSAAIALREQDDQQAIDHYLTVLETQPKNVAALNNLAWLTNKSDPQQALKYAQRAVRLSTNPQVLDTYGVVLLGNQRAENAVKILRLAAQRDTGSTDIRLHLAEALIASDQRPQAREILDRLAVASPTAEQSEKIQQLLGKL